MARQDCSGWDWSGVADNELGALRDAVANEVVSYIVSDIKENHFLDVVLWFDFDDERQEGLYISFSALDFSLELNSSLRDTCIDQVCGSAKRARSLSKMLRSIADEVDENAEGLPE